MNTTNNLPQAVIHASHTGMNGYHTMGGRRMDNVNEHHPYRIGFEIEKMNVAAKRMIEQAHPLAPGWIAERDGSLDNAGPGGYELISPAYNPCFEGRINADLDGMAPYIDAEPATAVQRNACGGHIHVSDSRCAPSDLADRIKPLFPLLMIMYPNRLKNGYVRCNKFAYMKRLTGQKYQPFYIRSSEVGRTIEFRIFPHVKSVSQLKWRMRLVTFFLNAAQHGSLSFEWMSKQLVEGSELMAILGEVYNAEERKAKAMMYWSAASFFFTDRPVAEVVSSVFGQAAMND